MHDRGPLTGVRVLDLSRVLSGPSCGKALADLGADVIKGEPLEGDLTWTEHPSIGGSPAYCAAESGGKRCVSGELRLAAGREVVQSLAENVAVVHERFRPGVLVSLGI